MTKETQLAASAIPTLSDIRAAAKVLEGQIAHTPFLHSRTLSAITGAEVHIKFENLQFTASFKERGALNKLMSLTAEERVRGVVAMSAGNHAQGVAYHAQRLKIPATIVMPESTPFIKAQQTQGFGAEVILKGKSIAEAAEIADEVRLERNLTFVHPYDDPKIIAGQGTIGIEIAGSGVALDAVVVPIGGGGLISGIAIALDALMPQTEVIGVEAELFPAMRAVLRGVEAHCGGTTIAEGIAVSRMGEITTAACRKFGIDVILASETMIERAIFLYLTIEKTVAEGAGAAPLAALLTERERFKGKRVGLILAGGNIDPRLLSSVIMRELIRDGRIFKIAIDVEDLPGQLSRVAGAIGKAGGSILEVQHSRFALDISAKHTVLELLIEARDARHSDAICEALEGDGLRVRRLS
ncbi:MAG TPA: threonine ammonia-lyase [Alphaproteobacteria bacterium]|nr:threonine ammonia-lyase [Alphaproteobacteria bacterium]